MPFFAIFRQLLAQERLSNTGKLLQYTDIATYMIQTRRSSGLPIFGSPVELPEIFRTYGVHPWKTLRQGG